MPLPFPLHDYQQQAIVQTRNHFVAGRRAICIQAPTGAGKSVIGSAIADSAVSKNNNVLILTHRAELLTMWAETLAKFGHKAELFDSENLPTGNHPLVVGMVPTMSRRNVDHYPRAAVVIIDEAHHSPSASFLRLIDHYKKCNSLIIGLTATPCRLDGKGLDDIFQALVLGPQTNDLIEWGRLAPFDYYVPVKDLGLNTNSLKLSSTGDFTKKSADQFVMENAPILCASIVEEYKRLSNNSRAIVFAQSLAQAELVEQAFQAAGISAAFLSGETDKLLRKTRIHSFKAGTISVLINVDLFGEGLDIPAVECCILARPTASLTIYLQQVGRALRYVPGKVASIIDLVGNYERHGLPDDYRFWSLQGRKKRDEREAEISETTKIVKKPDGNLVRVVDPNLVEKRASKKTENLDKETRKKLRESKSIFDQEKYDIFLADLIEIQQAQGYKPSWVYYRVRESLEKARCLPTLEYMQKVAQAAGYKPGKGYYDYQDLKRLITLGHTELPRMSEAN